jgi:hypothetical protein
MEIDKGAFVGIGLELMIWRALVFCIQRASYTSVFFFVNVHHSVTFIKNTPFSLETFIIDIVAVN